MQKIHFSIHIAAPKEKVWHTMLDLDTDRIWTSAFNDGSYYEGNWEKGSKIRFIGANPETREMGSMVSEIGENMRCEHISIILLGILKDGVEDALSDRAKEWATGYEN